MLGWQTSLEGTDGNVIIIALYLIIHLPVPIRVGLQGLPFSHGQGKEGIQGSRNPTARDEVGAEGLD